MWPFHRKLLALCILSAGLVCAPVANADPLMATGFTVGWQSVTLTSPGFVLGPTIHAGALNLNPPAGVIGYCIDIFQTISFNSLYNDYTPKSLATDGFLTGARKGEIAQLFHGFYDMSLTSSTKSAAFQLALWEIVFETGPKLNVDGANADHGVTYATSPDTPGNVITTANLWLGGLGSFSTDLAGITTYRSSANQDLIGYHHVPEPATWTLLLAGLGLVTFMVRRRVNG
jgi:hypothetical protein